MSDNILNSTDDMYADNTFIYFSCKDVKIFLKKCLNDDLASLSKWFDGNMIKANVSKTKFMLLDTLARTSKLSMLMLNE